MELLKNLFTTHCLEKHFSKRDAFILLGADAYIYTDTFQYMAGIQILYYILIDKNINIQIIKKYFFFII